MNKLPQQTSETRNSAPSLATSTRISARELYKYVLGLVGIFMLFVITYPLAIYRVERQVTATRSQIIPNSFAVESTSIESPQCKSSDSQHDLD
jgi:hypothetical protein